MKDIKLVDGAAAVWSQDAQALARALSAGWSLPAARLRAGRTEDLSLILRVVASGWVEGWRIWLGHRPDFATHPILVEAIIAHAQDEILEVLLEHEKGRLSWERDDDDLAPVHLLFQLLGNEIKHLAEDQKVVRVAKILNGIGFDVNQPYPGDFESTDMSPPGHTLWTWSIVRSYFDLGLALEAGDEVFKMPRHAEALDHWFDRAWVPGWVSSGKAFDGGRARVTWLQWMTPSRFAAWSASGDHLRNVELHDIIPALPGEYQKDAWATWVGNGDGQWSVLHDLVSSLLPSEKIEAALSAMEKSLPPDVWSRGWKGEDDYGMSASGIWEARKKEAAAQEA